MNIFTRLSARDQLVCVRAMYTCIISLQIEFEISFNGKITSTKCWKLAVKGYTMVGLSTTVSAEIRNCSNIQEVRPSVVIDAVGEVVAVEGKSDLLMNTVTFVNKCIFIT